MKKNNKKLINGSLAKGLLTEGKIDLSKGESVVCYNCGCPYFKNVTRMYRISAIISPTGEEGFIPQPTMICNHCSAVLDPAKKYVPKKERVGL